MALTRRSLIVGGGLALVAGAGLWRVARTPETATAPWEALARPEPDLRLDAFRHAILAPNPHNRQPWLIRLDGDDGAALFCDLDRRLPMTDPFDRQTVIGFGCFVELAALAAAARGAALEVTPFPEGEPQPRLDRRPVARLRFVGGRPFAPDPLVAAIPHRRSTKTPFEDRAVAADLLSRLHTESPSAGVSTIAEPARVAAVRALVLEALAVEMNTARTHRESIELTRIGAREVDADPDGIDIAGPGIEAMAAAGLIDRASLMDPTSMAFRQGETMMAESYGSAPAFLVVATPDNSRAAQLAAGRAYARANLAATALGLAMHPMSQSLQEYPEMADIFAAMTRLLLPNGQGRVHMLARLGHATLGAPAPRWPLETRLV